MCFEMGSEMTLVVGVSMRVLPSLERHKREADWVGAAPEAGWVLVAHSEHDGGVGGGICGGWPTAALSLARPARMVYSPDGLCASYNYCLRAIDCVRYRT